jgi:hypothetical protein
LRNAARLTQCLLAALPLRPCGYPVSGSMPTLARWPASLTTTGANRSGYRSASPSSVSCQRPTSTTPAIGGRLASSMIARNPCFSITHGSARVTSMESCDTAQTPGHYAAGAADNIHLAPIEV